MSNYAISRIQSYKYNACGAIIKEALRTLPNYDNPDCDPNKSHLNYTLIECDLKGLTIEKYILKYRIDNNIKGRFNTNGSNSKSMTNVMCQALFTTSKEYLDNMSRSEQINYFNHCLEFFKNEFPTTEILSAVIHYDETTPHLHVTFLPVYERTNKAGEKEKIFSTTLLMPGRDFFGSYQDRFYKHISKHYNGLKRCESDFKHFSVKEYKKLCYLADKVIFLENKLESITSTALDVVSAMVNAPQLDRSLMKINFNQFIIDEMEKWKKEEEKTQRRIDQRYGRKDKGLGL